LRLGPVGENTRRAAVIGRGELGVNLGPSSNGRFGSLNNACAFSESNGFA